ncbi:nucleotide-binding universal stress UspA family protein [Kibdelosporangium banguiense]|uniref:Nucleotide-binding universal stress UspA family protein n=1 Tax=Kibdelosporangium banguiense TaxID=1365924 RepID=A0ABS4TWM6_9PSEU|nr:universal stress protein [Kibdelosporangium banguiense]MBP2328795.1 nucleotide-binding universal stress UspA family protein [Kibdelosporangium banguiense]
MNKPIIVGVDGSTVSIAALRWAIDEAIRRGVTVTAVNAWHSDPAAAGLNRLDLIQLRPRSEVLEAQRELLANAVNQAGHTVEITELLLEGQPGPALVQAAAEADLLVVGSHGYNRLYEALLGSVSSYCVHHSPCPVVVIPDAHRKHEKAPVTEDAPPLTIGPLL